MREYRAHKPALHPDFPTVIGEDLEAALTTSGFDLTRDVHWYDDYDAIEVAFYQYEVCTASETEPRTYPRFIKNLTPPFQGPKIRSASLDINVGSVEDFAAKVDAILADFWGNSVEEVVYHDGGAGT